MSADWSFVPLGGGKSTTRPDAAVARLAALQWGVISAAELQRCGLSRRAVESRVRDGHLHPLYRGVYAVGHSKLPLEGSFLAAVKACGPTAHLSHFSAGALYGLVRWDHRYPEVTVTSKRLRPGIRTHRTAVCDRTHHHGIPVTTPARTLIDLAGTLNYRALTRAVREAQRQLVTIPQILQTLDQLGPRRGSAKLTKILATGPAPTRSELEDTVLELILNAGFQHPDVNVPIQRHGRTIIPDFRWPDHHLVIEADGAHWHEDPLTRQDDADKQAILEAAGEHVIRITWAQAITHRTQTTQRIKAAGAPG
jgi:very-short-patch-repair endonuclease